MRKANAIRRGRVLRMGFIMGTGLQKLRRLPLSQPIANPQYFLLLAVGFQLRSHQFNLPKNRLIIQQ
jgi:hypothetical protein